MNTEQKRYATVLYVSLTAFILFAVYILYLNLEMFYTVHERSEFLFGAPFFHTLLSKPFGLMQYVGAWLTQLFYYPSLGAGILLVIWALIFFVGVKAFRLHGNSSALILLPVACLLTSVVDLGYWVYILTIRGYWFSQSVSYLIMLTLLWAAVSTPRKWHLVWYVLAFCSYPILGWFAILFVICLAIIEKPTWRELLGFTLILFAAGIWRTLLYSNLKSDDVNALAGMPRFVTASDCSEHLTIPFYLLGAISVLISLVSRYLTKAYVPVVCAVLSIAFTWSLMFSNRNYIDEMRMVRYAEDDNWEEVLDIASESTKPTTSMIILKNIALMYKGGLLDCSFVMGNNSNVIYNPDSVHVSFLEIASPVAYYNYGMLNEGVRLNFENSVQAGFSPFYLKSLVRCAHACGEKELADRYSAQLRHHLFYENWRPAPVSEEVSQLSVSYSDELTGVENSDSYLVNRISMWYESGNRLASEQALFYSMIRCDSRRFWKSLRKYVKTHDGEVFPLHAQEAYLLFLDKAPEDKRVMLPVEENVYERYKQFWTILEQYVKGGMGREETQEKMREDWADTYWYYNIFERRNY